MSVLQIFNWLGETRLGTFMQQSSFAFPLVEMVHLLSLAVLGGAILLVNVRSLGLGIKSQSAAVLANELGPYIAASLSASIISGVLLLAEEPMKCYYNLAFRLKMLFLVLAVLFYFSVQRRLLRTETRGQFVAKAAALTSLALWLAVGLAGRAIGVI